MGLLDNLGSNASEAAEVLGVGSDAARPEAFPRPFQIADWDSFGGEVEAAQFKTFADYQVEAGTELAFGKGSAANEANQGYLYVDVQQDNGDGTTSAVSGTLRLAYASPTQRSIEVVADFNSDELKGSKSDRTMRVPLPEQVQKSTQKQDEYLLLQFRSDSGTMTIDADPSEVTIPMTEYDLS